MRRDEDKIQMHAPCNFHSVISYKYRFRTCWISWTEKWSKWKKKKQKNSMMIQSRSSTDDLISTTHNQFQKSRSHSAAKYSSFFFFQFGIFSHLMGNEFSIWRCFHTCASLVHIYESERFYFYVIQSFFVIFSLILDFRCLEFFFFHVHVQVQHIWKPITMPLFR